MTRKLQVLTAMRLKYERKSSRQAWRHLESEDWIWHMHFRSLWPRLERRQEVNAEGPIPWRVLFRLRFQEADWFICYFRVLGKSFRGDFWRVLTCFLGSFRPISESKYPEKIAENPLKSF